MKKEIEYDELRLYVKKTKKDEIVNHYKVFGWNLVSINENKRYEDIVDLEFKRPHKIKEKDELQLLQVYMEENVNQTARLERNKYSKATAFALFFGVIGLALLVLAVLNLLKIISWFSLPVIISFCCVGILFLLFTIIFTPKIFKSDKLKFLLKKNDLSEKLDIICKKASLILGGQYE